MITAMTLPTLNGLPTALTQAAQHWLTAHLNVEGLMANPLASFGLVCLVIFLGLGLLSAIAHVTESIWLFAARLPWRLMRWLLGWVGKIWQIPATRLAILPFPQRNHAPDRIAEILTRLTTLQKEQDQLTQELSHLLSRE
ncbi:MAG: hypothetical protein HC812_15925 [Leptolyngbya sp. RL_3_1]|nr:hypothetical protein [Leptolyngbya sp. RL_3_1]